MNYKRFIIILSVAIWLLWISLFLSYRRAVPTPDANTGTFAFGGFPIKAFDYPVPPLGTNVIPSSMLWVFGLDFVIWVGVVGALSFLFPKWAKKFDQYYWPFIVVSLLMMFAGYAYLMIRFD